MTYLIYNNLNNRYTNVNLLEESDFNITPPNIYIWRGVFPYKSGDIFPPDEVRQRAGRYLTYKNLYDNKFDGIMDNVFSWSDYMQNPITNFPNMAIIADLPDYQVAAESWVELISAKPPRILSSDSSKSAYNINYLSSVLVNSNFATEVQDIIRCAYCIFGNKVLRVNKLDNGSVNLINMPIKCWIPWVNENDITTIEVNMFFNIFTNLDGHKLCQFISYYENGLIEKRTFEMRGDRLGELVGEVETARAFDNADISPIIVFTGDRVNGNIYGLSQFPYWDASISFGIRAYEALGVLVEQLKEVYRVLPDGVTRTDEDSGITYQSNTGAIVYKGENAPGVSLVKAQIALDQGINAYITALKRIAKDTGLPISYFDETYLGGKISADALRTSMFRSELKAEKIISLFKNDIKRLIVRIAKAVNIDIDVGDFELNFSTGFVNDKELQMKIIQARSGNAITMSRADAIAAYDEISTSQALIKAEALEGKQVDEADDRHIENTTSGGESTVDNGVNFDHVSEQPNIVKPIVETPIGLI